LPNNLPTQSGAKINNSIFELIGKFFKGLF
jgi:hypothetical protein